MRGKQTNNSERGQEKERDLKRKGKREVERETKGNGEEKQEKDIDVLLLPWKQGSRT